jgi:NAD(P)H-flavin reductase/hemoglobin-like flavoprotein
MNTQATLVRESWTLVAQQSDDLANDFYARIFLADEALRELFPVEMTAVRMHLLDALVTVLRAIDDPDRYDMQLRALGRAHRRFHIEPAHYGVFGQALLESLRNCAGDRWTVSYDEAWRDAYDEMATKMLSAAEQVSHTPPFWHAEVTSHHRRGRGDVAVFTCKPLMPFSFRAGQYVAVEGPHLPRMWRYYSIANAPREVGTLDFHVRAHSAGLVSSALVRRLHVGDLVRLGPPDGSMTLNRESTRDVVCVAGGTGLAPVKSLVQELARHNRNRWVHVFFGARDRDDLYDLAALQALSSRYPWLSVVPACSDDPTYAGERGDVSEVVERFGPWPDHDFYVSGSPAMVESTLWVLARMGVPPAWIRYDPFAGLPEPEPALSPVGAAG